MKGIVPYASGKILQRIVARPNISGVPSTPGESGATLSKQERVRPLIRPGLRPVHLPRRGRLPPAGDSLFQSVLDL